MTTEITQEMQDKFRQSVIDKIKQHFPDTDIKSPLIINNEANFGLAMGAQDKITTECIHMVNYGCSAVNFDDAINQALIESDRMRFMKAPNMVYIRATSLEYDKDFGSRTESFEARARLIFMYEEK